MLSLTTILNLDKVGERYNLQSWALATTVTTMFNAKKNFSCCYFRCGNSVLIARPYISSSLIFLHCLQQKP